MKAKSKAILFVVTMLLSLALTLTGVSAAADADIHEGESLVGADADVAASEAVSDASTDAPGADDTEGESEKDENPFMLLYGALCENAPVIMSALAAIASVILAFCYRKGLIPMLKDALGGMLSAVNTLKCGVSESDARAKEITAALGERLDAAEKAVARISELLDGISRSDEGLCGINAVMSEQVELLYDLFMQSSLPEFKKERIGKRVAAMREKLSAPEVESDDA